MPSGLHESESIDTLTRESLPFDDRDSIDLTALVRRLREGRRTIGAFVLGSAASGLALCFLLPVKYTSTTSFIPPSNAGNSSTAMALAGQLAGLGGGGDLLGLKGTSSELYTGMLKSRSVLGEIVKRFDLMKIYRTKKEISAEKLLSSDTVIAADAKSSIITVSVNATSPQLAHDLASAYIEALRNTEGRLALTQASQRRMFFSQQLAREKDDLANAEVELKKTEEQSGLIAPTGQTEAQIRTMAETQAQIAVRQVQLASLRQSATEENPEVIRLRTEINDLQAQLSRMQQGQSNGLTIPTSKVPAIQLDYVRKQRDVKYHEALFEMLSRQYEAARLDEAREAPALQVLDVASYPEGKSSPRRTLIMIGALLLGLILGSIWVFLRGSVMRFGEGLKHP